MPPWDADPRCGHFRNERGLKPDEISKLAVWVDGGALESDPPDRPVLEKRTESWTIPPDMVISLPRL